MGDPRAGLDEPGQLAVREMHGVGEHRALAEAAGAVVDVDVVGGLGKQPRDLLDLAAVLGDVGLPVRPGRGARGPPIRAAGRRCTRPRTGA